MIDLIIKMDDGKFWSFGSFVSEYPDAQVYATELSACREADRLAKETKQGVTVIAFYGMSNETGPYIKSMGRCDHDYREVSGLPT